jgi:cGMP-dependent protein kinase 2
MVLNSRCLKRLFWKIFSTSPSHAFVAGMLNGRVNDIKRHKWFEGLDWDALGARRLEAPRKPKNDSEKRVQEIMEAEAHEERPEEDANELAECEVVFADF